MGPHRLMANQGERVKADPVLDMLLKDFTPEERADLKLVEAVKGTFEYQRLTLVHAARQFGEAFVEHVGGSFILAAERTNDALRRWWNDPR